MEVVDSFQAERNAEFFECRFWLHGLAYYCAVRVADDDEFARSHGERQHPAVLFLQRSPARGVLAGLEWRNGGARDV